MIALAYTALGVMLATLVLTPLLLRRMTHLAGLAVFAVGFASVIGGLGFEYAFQSFAIGAIWIGLSSLTEQYWRRVARLVGFRV